MKTIKVKPVESIRIQLEDKDYVCSFNMLAMATMQEAISKLDCNLNEVSPAHMTALILYSGIKPNEAEFTLEDANALAMQMDPACYSEIMNMYNDAIFESMNDEDKKKLKKMMALYLSGAKK